jgi:hypothetical protein
LAAEQKANGFKDTKVSRHETVDGDHGPIEKRTYTQVSSSHKSFTRFPWAVYGTLLYSLKPSMLRQERIPQI